MRIEMDFDEAGMKRIDEQLAKIEANLRGNAVKNGLRAIGRQVATETKAVLPTAGYTRYTRPSGNPYTDKDGPKPLGQTVKTKLLNYADGQVHVAITGYQWPAGAHGHLVEMGHDLVRGGQTIGHVEPAEYMVSVVEKSRAHHDSIMIEAAKKLLKT